MKVLIVGSGGREHAIAWSVSRSPKADKIYCAPGNAGIAEYAECVNIGAMEFEKLADFFVYFRRLLTHDFLSVFYTSLNPAVYGYSDLVKMQQSWKAPRHFPRI